MEMTAAGMDVAKARESPQECLRTTQGKPTERIYGSPVHVLRPARSGRIIQMVTPSLLGRFDEQCVPIRGEKYDSLATCDVPSVGAEQPLPRDDTSPVLPGPEPGTFLVKRRRSVNIWTFLAVGVVLGAIAGAVVNLTGADVPVSRSMNPGPFLMFAGACLGAIVMGGVAALIEGLIRGDGLLNHDLLPGDKGPQDACGVFGVWAPGEEVAKLSYYGLYALQHRGQESAGIAVADGNRVLVFKEMGLVSQVFQESTLAHLTGHVAIGHARYSTTGGSTWENAQPTLGGTDDQSIALAHNGNLTNSAELRDLLLAKSQGVLGFEQQQGNTTDTGLVTALLSLPPTSSSAAEPADHAPAGHTPGSALAADQTTRWQRTARLEERAMEVLPLLKGAFCFVFMDENTLYAARDPQGIRPLVLGRLANGWVVASETAALDIVGASFIREVEPGEFLVIDPDGMRSRRFAKPQPKGCVFEYVYLARPDTTIRKRGVYAARVEMGRQLAREHPIEADMVMPAPESGTPAAIGYAEESGIPYGMGLVKNAYVGRTFISPSQTIRQLGIRLKLNPLKEIIHGKRIIVVDDSIVRGNTQRAVVKMLRESGAVEVHVRISSPPVRWPCFYGIDFATRAELIANGLDIHDIARSIGADSLGYISEDGMVAATDQPRSELCTACFSGIYPTDLPSQDLLGKSVLESTAPKEFTA
ncbi:amidohydrolase [Platysternon megacephalum]|uniref:Amidophosphoribosyltransferase n=1 Tax=Platysternon megacephalum TaxID=55544 RepID=A0A4D9DCE0_9SAUR|nr:amidohydrolase [Platysternon megacephalum]